MVKAGADDEVFVIFLTEEALPARKERADSGILTT